MKLHILGAGYGFPGISTLVECNGSYYIVDAGAPVAELMYEKKVSLNDLQAVFISHRHGDHTTGLSTLAHMINSGYKKTGPVAVLLPEECVLTGFQQLMLSMKNAINESKLQMKLYEPGVIYQDENIKVTAIPTDHVNGLHPANALVIEGDGQRVIFTGDLHREDPYDFPAIAESEPSDAIVCEFEHFHMDALLPHMKKCQTKQFIFHHYNAAWSLEEITALQQNNPLPYPIILAKNGDEITI